MMNFRCLSSKWFLITFKKVKKSDCVAGRSCGTRLKMKILSSGFLAPSCAVKTSQDNPACCLPIAVAGSWIQRRRRSTLHECLPGSATWWGAGAGNLILHGEDLQNALSAPSRFLCRVNSINTYGRESCSREHTSPRLCDFSHKNGGESTLKSWG